MQNVGVCDAGRREVPQHSIGSIGCVCDADGRSGLCEWTWNAAMLDGWTTTIAMKAWGNECHRCQAGLQVLIRLLNREYTVLAASASPDHRTATLLGQAPVPND
uniref:Uncharacterized protein n=1 Tax=Eutreptiella gymnastica TaxID=73025 RepID=A0A7S4CZB1_9EUGL